MNATEIMNLEHFEDIIDENMENDINSISCSIAGHEYAGANENTDILIENESKIASETANDIITAIENNLNKNHKSKAPPKNKIIGGLSPSTFFTFSHTLRVMVHCIRHLLTKCGFNYALPGFINNERIEELCSIF